MQIPVVSAPSCADEHDPESLSVSEARRRILADVEPIAFAERLALRAEKDTDKDTARCAKTYHEAARAESQKRVTELIPTRASTFFILALAGITALAGIQALYGQYEEWARVLGRDCVLYPQVTIYDRVTIGDRFYAHGGCVIGSDGFGMAWDDDHWERVPQLGSVRIADDVDIGANTTVDRGSLDDTVIEEGVKIDNQVQVAHNVVIGAHTAIAGCVGISGSARIGSHCALAGGVGIVGHLEICDHVQITGMSMVTRSIREPGIYSAGTPLMPNAQWRRNAVTMKRLDALARRIRALEKASENK